MIAGWSANQLKISYRPKTYEYARKVLNASPHPPPSSMTCTKVIEHARHANEKTKHAPKYSRSIRRAEAIVGAAKARSDAPTAETRSAMPRTISYTNNAPNTHTWTSQKSPVTRPDSRSVRPIESEAVHAMPAKKCVSLARKVMNRMSPSQRERTSWRSRK